MSFDKTRLERLHAVIEGHVEAGTTHGVTWLAASGDHVEVGAAGAQRDSIYRIASMTKPITAVAALVLIEEGRLRLADPVDDLLPELANRRVLVDGRGSMDGDTVPAHRPITVRDCLAFTLGYGMDFEAPWPQPLLEKMGEFGLGDGPPGPQGPPGPDAWIAALGSLPLLYQPGEKWLYNVGSDVLTVLIGRAADQPFDAFLQERIFEPLGMKDTGFVVSDASRLGPSYSGDTVYDPPDGQWTTAPAFPAGAGGLVSTVDDYFAFARVLLAGGAPLISRASHAAMTTGQATGFVADDGSMEWGFGVGVTTRRTGVARSVGSYGWDGGLGSSWANDPAEDFVGIILTTDMFTGPFPPPRVIQDFWTLSYAALA